MVRLTWEHGFRAASLSLACWLLAACATSTVSTTPTTGTDPDSRGSTTFEPADRTSDRSSSSSATRSSEVATLALLQQSARAEQTGALPEAMAYAERAVRIDPHRADLWTRLAMLELRNGDSHAAIQYANKALTLAGDRPDWQRDAWLVIADAKEAEGDGDGARSIRAKWRSFRG